MLAGKMVLPDVRSQSGGYHYFLHPVARQLQRYVRQHAQRPVTRRHSSPIGSPNKPPRMIGCSHDARAH